MGATPLTATSSEDPARPGSVAWRATAKGTMASENPPAASMGATVFSGRTWARLATQRSELPPTNPSHELRVPDPGNSPQISMGASAPPTWLQLVIVQSTKMSFSWACVRLPTPAAGDPGVERQFTGATASRAKATNRSTSPDCVHPSTAGPAEERATCTNGTPAWGAGSCEHRVARPFTDPVGNRLTTTSWS